jgi:hypothetical protein
MSTSKHAFDQVKSILGKLDRAIDATRARRLDPSHAHSAAPSTPPGQQTGEARREYAGQAPAAAPTAPANGGVLDPTKMQARPLRPSEPFGTTPPAFSHRPPDLRRA